MCWQVDFLTFGWSQISYLTNICLLQTDMRVASIFSTYFCQVWISIFPKMSNYSFKNQHDPSKLKSVCTQDALSSVLKGNFENPWSFLKSCLISFESGYLFERQGWVLILNFKRCEVNTTVSGVNYLYLAFLKPLCSFLSPSEDKCG